MEKYIDSEKLIATLERQNVDKKVIEPVIRIIDSLQQEQNSIQDSELTGFESALFTAFSYAWQSYLRGEEVNVVQWAKENSAELLEAARCQQEQQEVDLEKFTEKMDAWEARKHVFDNSPIGTSKDAFIAGAEWQKSQMLEDVEFDSQVFGKVMSDILAVYKSPSNPEEEPLDYEWTIARQFYKLGKQAMKEQTFKDAVGADAEVCKLTERVCITPIDEKKFHQDVYDNFKAGDKVRLIVLKEEEE